MRKGVVITGMGAVTPIGSSWEAFWEGTRQGASPALMTDFSSEIDTYQQIACQINDFNPEVVIPKKEISRLDRFSQLVLVAAHQALEDAGIAEEELARKVGVVIGSGVGGMTTAEQQYIRFNRCGLKAISPFFIPMMMINAAASAISIYFHIKGPSYTVATACSSGTHAIGQGIWMIRNGLADVVLCGGGDAPLLKPCLAGFEKLGVLSKHHEIPEKAMRPFSKNRDGFVMGEGAGMLILEEKNHARKRGVKIYCDALGYGLTSDAFHLTAPEDSGEMAAQAIINAIDDAQIDREQIDYINAHGSATFYNDKIETSAIKKVFGRRAKNIPVSAIKPTTGHTIGGAGPLEAIACVAAIRENIIPPTINYDEADPECDLNYVPHQAIEDSVKVAMSNAFGFGGSNAVLIFGQYEEAAGK